MLQGDFETAHTSGGGITNDSLRLHNELNKLPFYLIVRLNVWKINFIRVSHVAIRDSEPMDYGTAYFYRRLRKLKLFESKRHDEFANKFFFDKV